MIDTLSVQKCGGCHYHPGDVKRTCEKTHDMTSSSLLTSTGQTRSGEYVLGTIAFIAVMLAASE